MMLVKCVSIGVEICCPRLQMSLPSGAYGKCLWWGRRCVIAPAVVLARGQGGP